MWMTDSVKALNRRSETLRMKRHGSNISLQSRFCFPVAPFYVLQLSHSLTSESTVADAGDLGVKGGDAQSL